MPIRRTGTEWIDDLERAAARADVRVARIDWRFWREGEWWASRWEALSAWTAQARGHADAAL